ncbi:ABC transporter ATP-binding protein [Candidatus Saccharibacteria bacterium]|nr:MAG: ABC transporter ATP-binding protein [Candidatus Saccharibacteria bacterium]
MRQRREIVMTVDELRIRRSNTFQLHVPFLRFMAGGSVCIVGANGSGKTTLVETLVGLIIPREGSVRVSGLNAHDEEVSVKRAVGYIPDDDAWLIAELTAAEFFDLLVSVHAQHTSKRLLEKRVKELANELLFESFHSQLGSLSHGNKKKVQIIAGLLHEPNFVVVDELRNGLDPIAIARAEALLRRKQIGGTSIIAATHDLWWAERFAEEIIMIRRGHVILNDYTREIVAKSGSLEARFMEVYDNVA